MIPAAVLSAVLSLSRAPDQSAVDAIERHARAARVPVSLALAVCTLESGVGTRGAILCGCYVRVPGDPGGAVDRSVAAQARCVAGTLAHGRRVCGSWGASLRRYRYGLGRASEHGCPLADPRSYLRRVQAYQRMIAGRVREPAVVL